MLSTMQVWSHLLDIKFTSAVISIKGTINLFGMLGIDDNISAGFQQITVDIKIESDESEERVQQLVEAVEKHCLQWHLHWSMPNVSVKSGVSL